MMDHDGYQDGLFSQAVYSEEKYLGYWEANKNRARHLNPNSKAQKAPSKPFSIGWSTRIKSTCAARRCEG
jgi:hypothetical protein